MQLNKSGLIFKRILECKSLKIFKACFILNFVISRMDHEPVKTRFRAFVEVYLKPQIWRADSSNNQVRGLYIGPKTISPPPPKKLFSPFPTIHQNLLLMHTFGLHFAPFAFIYPFISISPSSFVFSPYSFTFSSFFSSSFPCFSLQ